MLKELPPLLLLVVVHVVSLPLGGFELLNTHVVVSRETFSRFEIYCSLLLKWQSKINLVGPDTLKDVWGRHFLDSLQLANHLPDEEKTIIDMGVGAGFPGMVLAIFGIKNINLIESDARKITFLREVARVTNTNVSIHHCRIEDQPILSPDVITSRACSSLDNLLSLSFPFVSRETICLFHKGKNYTKEIDDAKLHWQFDYSIAPSIVDQQGVIIALSKIRKPGDDSQKHQPHT